MFRLAFIQGIFEFVQCLRQKVVEHFRLLEGVESTHNAWHGALQHALLALLLVSHCSVVGVACDLLLLVVV